jgi:hypothetical protein
MVANSHVPDDDGHGSADYTKRVVGFIDILGFKDEVRKADADDRRRAQLLKALQIIQSAVDAKEVDLRSQNL